MKKKTLDELKASGLVQSASSFTTKPRKKLKARAKSNPGWYRWAVENIWNKRERRCEICGMSLEGFGEEPNPIVFSHLLERGSYRLYIRSERNVMIKCPGHHGEWHNRPKEELLSPTNPYRLKWKAMFLLEEALKLEANGITQP